MPKLLVVSGAVLSIVVGAAATACSSSSSLLLPDAGGSDSGTRDAGGGGVDSGTLDSTVSDTGPGDSGGGDTGPLACPPMSTSGFKAATYVPAVAHQGLCTAADITAFVKACGDNGTTATCNTWLSTNAAGQAADSGGAGNACGNCIFAPMNNGATWTDPDQFFTANYGGCIQLTDPTKGPACAAALENLNGCNGLACDMACPANDPNPAADTQACIGAAQAGSCSTYATTEQSACAIDLGDGGAAGNTCFPGGGSSMNPDLTYIATLICGGESDGGVMDSGTDTGTVQDGGVADTGEADTGARDSGAADTAVADTAVADTAVADTATTDSGSSGSCNIPNGSYQATQYSCGNSAPMSFPASIVWTANYQAGAMSTFSYTIGTCSQIENGPSSCTNGVLEVDDTMTSCSPANCAPFGPSGCTTAIGAFYWQVSQITATTFVLSSMNQPDGGPTPIETCTGQGLSNPIQVTWQKM